MACAQLILAAVTLLPAFARRRHERPRRRAFTPSSAYWRSGFSVVGSPSCGTFACRQRRVVPSRAP